MTWSVARHRVWPASFRRTVFTILCVAQRHDRVGLMHKSTTTRRSLADPLVEAPLTLPRDDVWLGLIVSYLGREDFNFRCDGCGKVGLDERARCRGCRVVFFCSDQCQVDRWGVHKAGCRAAQRKRKEERAAKRAAQKAARKSGAKAKTKTKP